MSTERRDVENAATLVGLVPAMQIFWQVAELRVSLHIFLTVNAFLLGLSFTFNLRILRLHECNDGLAHPEWCAQIGVNVSLPLFGGGYIFHRSVTGCEERACDAYTISYLMYLIAIQGEL
jgi:hypothetical protein